MGFWNFFTEEEEEFDDNSEFQKLIDNGEIKPENYSYKYQKPMIYETMTGDYDKFWEDFCKDAKIVIIPGMRRSGKGVIAFSLAENIAKTNEIPVYSLGTDSEDLPNFITNIDTIDDLPNDCILVVSEGGIESNSRKSMTKANVAMSSLLSIVSHKRIWLVYCLDKNTEIQTPTGIKKLCDLKKTDLVYSWDFKENKRVVALANKLPSSKKKVYKITMEDGRIVRCSGDHRWWAYTDNGLEVIKTKDLNKKTHSLCTYD